MPTEDPLADAAFRAAHHAHERQERLNTGKVAAALVVFLMPAGVVLDYFVYPARLGEFLAVRLICSALAGMLWLLHITAFGERHYRFLGLPIALVPALGIAWMIYVTEGHTSPYYAGLNLVLLAVSAVVHWSTCESLLAVTAVMLVYGLASAARGGDVRQGGIFVNNFYFLVLTGIIVVTGNVLFNRLRFREFALRYELDKNRVQLQESNRKLTELDQIKSRFFANISHELRTPLTLLLAPLETLLQRFGRHFDEQAKNLLQTMHGNGMRLLKLINDLLDLVRLDSGVMQVKREGVEIQEFLRGLVSAARQMADDKRIRLNAHVEPEVGTVSVDRDKLEKIILNLQFNALKFTPAGGKVELRSERQGEQLIIKVVDTGMGISAKNLPHVFDRFWQADGSARRKYQGVGIGLALVKELVEVQGGDVSVESQEGKGTTFTVRLPYQQAETTAPAAESQTAATSDTAAELAEPASIAARGGTHDEWLSNLYRRAELFPSMTSVADAMRPVEVTRNGTGPKILIADDEPDMLRFLKSQLAAHYQVVEAVDGNQAIEKASQFLPDIILCDIMMPEKDGLQVCRELRQRTVTQSIPIILLTARADEDTKLNALSAGASDFLPKPFSTTELHVRVKNLVESYQFQRKLAKQNQLLENTIEQLKETETQLVQTEKLASLGRLSAGIIHEINNPLNFATTGLYLLKSQRPHLAPEFQDEFAEVLKDVEDGIYRVKTIVSDLRTFSHPDTEGLEELPLAEVVESALRFLSHEWRDKVNIEQDLSESVSIHANRTKLIQVMVNLLQNSLDALKRKSFEQDQPRILIEARSNQDRTVLRVRDNGSGIAPEIRDKIFDPFFTTKDVGEGMGLGLSICYRIVEQYGGRISVNTEPGQFCEFTLDFPVSGPEYAGAQAV